MSGDAQRPQIRELTEQVFVSRLPFSDVGAAIHVQHFSRHLISFGQINDRIDDVFHLCDLPHRLPRLEEILRLPLMHGRIDDHRRNGVDAYALLAILHRQAARDSFQASLDHHRNGRIDPRDRMIHLGRGDINDASAGVLSQHLLDRQLGDQEKTFEVDRCESTKIVNRVIREVFREIDAGVVDQRINRFEFVLRNFGDLRRGGRFANASVN